MNRDTFDDIRDDIHDKLACVPIAKPALIGVVVILVMVAVLAGNHINDTATAIEFSTEASSASAEAGEGSTTPKSIFVHVSGAVNAPGLCEVDEGSRLAQAVQAAGGFSDDADIDSVNLARIVSDGEQIYVLSKGLDGTGQDPDGGAEGGQAAAQSGQPDAYPGANAGGNTGAGTGKAAPTAASTKVNLNTATQADLETLPGIGPSTAAKIIADRTANGAFASVDDLTRVSGIGDKKLEALRDLVVV